MTLLSLMASHLVAHAAVTDVSHWRMGDQDPSSNPLTFATNTTDQTGGRTMTLFTSAGGFKPIYQADAPPVPAGNSKSLVFSLGAAGYAPLIPSLTDNFGIELWVKPNDITSTSYLAWNGASNNGWGFVKIGNVYQGVIKTPTGSQITVGGGIASLNTWTHLALVRENGLTVFYVNGVAVGISNQEISVPTGYFQLAVAPDRINAKFVGALDEVRVFTFAPNKFSKTDLLVPRLPLEADEHNAVTTTVGGAGETPRTYHARWMEGLPDSMRVSELSIPGTHDTGAERGNNYGGVPFPSYSDCQDAEVWDQLVSGVRFLDLRISRAEAVYGGWILHHNDTYYYRPLFNVLNEITQFLNDNPSETVLCRLTADVNEDKQIFLQNYGLIRDFYTNIWQRPGTFRADGVTPTEYADESIDTGDVITNALMNASLQNGSYYWPTLGEVRGKMAKGYRPDLYIFLIPPPILSPSTPTVCSGCPRGIHLMSLI